MIVRLAVEKDLNELQRIYYDSRLNHFTWLDNSQASLTDYDQATAGERVWLIEINNEIVGFMSVYEPENFIHLLFVKPGYESNGVGSNLLSELLRNQKETLSLKCLSRNKSACYFYQKHGFVIVREELDEREGAYYVMEKRVIS